MACSDRLIGSPTERKSFHFIFCSFSPLFFPPGTIFLCNIYTDFLFVSHPGDISTTGRRRDRENLTEHILEVMTIICDRTEQRSTLVLWCRGLFVIRVCQVNFTAVGHTFTPTKGRKSGHFHSFLFRGDTKLLITGKKSATLHETGQRCPADGCDFLEEKEIISRQRLMSRFLTFLPRANSWTSFFSLLTVFLWGDGWGPDSR